MADFEKFDLTKSVPITYGNSTGVAAQAGDEPTRAAPELTKEVVDSIQWMTGAPDVDGIPQPYAGAIVLLETFASIGMTAKRNGQPTPNSLLCMKFANDLRAAASPRATADVERFTLPFDIVMGDLTITSGTNLDGSGLVQLLKNCIATTKPGA